MTGDFRFCGMLPGIPLRESFSLVGKGSVSTRNTREVLVVTPPSYCMPRLGCGVSSRIVSCNTVREAENAVIRFRSPNILPKHVRR